MKNLLCPLLLVCMALSSCHTPGLGVPAADSTAKQITLTFAVPDWELEQGSVSKVVAEFERQNPDIHIVLKSSSEILGLPPNSFSFEEDTWRRLAAAADVFRVPMSYGGLPRQAVRERAVRDLVSFIEADPTFQAADFQPGALAAASWDGGIWALPTALDYEVILYDKAAFAAAGLAHPQPDWTWAELAQAATALTIRDGAQVTRWGFVNELFGYMPAYYAELRAGALLEQTGVTPAPLFTSPEAVAATQWWGDLIVKAQAAPFPDAPRGDGSGRTLVEQKLAALAAYSLQTATLRVRMKPQEFGVAPYPSASPINIEQLCMSAGTAHPEAAWRWLNFATRQMPFSMPPQMTYNRLPARVSVAETAKFWTDLPADVADTLRHAAAHPARSTLFDWPVAYQALNDALLAVFRGEQPVEAALAAAQAQALTALQAEASRLAAITPAPVIITTAEPPAPANATRITFLTTGDIGNTAALRAAAQQFRGAHPDVVVEVKTDNVAATDLAALAGQADCFQAMPNLDQPEITRALLSLEPFLEADTTLAGQDFFPVLLAQYQRNGQRWGLPAAAQPYVIEYNPVLFAAANVAMPPPTWSLADFLALAQQLTGGTGDTKRYGFVSTREPLELLVFVEQQGGRFLDDTQTPPAAAFADPGTVKAVQWYADLRLRHSVMPATTEDAQALIAAGRAALWVGPLADNGLPDVGVLPFPQGAARTPAALLHTTGYFISAQTAAPQACWAWIRFLADQPGVTAGLPARRTVATSDAFRQRVGAAQADAYLAAVTNRERPSTLVRLAGQDWLAPYLAWFEEAYQRIIKEEAPADAALAEAQKKADAYRRCVITTDASRASAGYQVCFRKVDPQAAGN